MDMSVDVDRDPDAWADYLQLVETSVEGDVPIWQDGFHWATFCRFGRRLSQGNDIAAVNDGYIVGRGRIVDMQREGSGLYVWTEPDQNAEYRGDL